MIPDRRCLKVAFGELIRATGPMAKVNPFRFSTKYQDDETELLYYGYRYYNPSTGRFLGRDPIEEDGEVNLYAFTPNNPITYTDYNGLSVCADKKWVAQGDGNYDVVFTASKCELKLTLRIAVEGQDDRSKRLVQDLMGIWQAGMSKWYSGWKTKPTDECCACCKNGINLTFNITFGSANPHRIVIVDSTSERSDVIIWHLGDRRFRIPTYSDVAHKVGHYFGLADEYPDKEHDPNRNIPNDWRTSIMGEPNSFSTLKKRHMVNITETSKVNDNLSCGPFIVQ